MGNKILLEEANNMLLESHSGTIKMENYNGMGKRAHFICLTCGNEWDTMANSIISRGRGCKICSMRNAERHIGKYTKDEVSKYILSQGCDWVDGEYNGAESELIIRFACGHAYSVKYGYFKNGSRCKICAREKSSIKQRLPEQEVFDLLESFGFNFIDFPNGYKNYKSEVRYECELGHITTRRVSVLKRGPTCRECKCQERIITSRNSIEHVIDVIELKDCEYIEGNYIDDKSDIKIKFSCGHEEWTTLNKFRSRTTGLCKKCASEYSTRNKKLTKDEIVLKLNEYNLVFKEFPDGYKNNCSKATYICEFGHETTRDVAGIMSKPTCTTCSRKYLSELHTGANNNWWKGGITPLRTYLNKQISNWKKECAAKCNYLDVLTGEPMEHVHHLMGFNLILQRAVDETGIELKETINDYSEEELNKLSERFRQIHTFYSGVALSESSHYCFHKNYGFGNNFPEQWYEFVDRVKSGEIIISN
jgi:hypothetical protein